MKKNVVWLLILAVLFILASSFYFLTNKQSQPAPAGQEISHHADVIVVGAGISGLTAALDLAQKGVSVLLLEKEAQVGGRLQSVMFDNIACNVGAQWVNAGLSPQVDPYIKRFPLQTIGNEDGGLAFTWKGKLIELKGDTSFDSLPFSEKAKKDFVASAIQMRKDAAALYPGIDFNKEKSWDYIYNLPTETPLWKKLEKETITQYLSAYDPDVTTLWGTRVSGGFGGSPDTISALFLVGWYRGSPFFPMTILKGGNHLLAEEMAKEFQKYGGKIVLKADVTEISQKGESVHVLCRSGQTYASDYCIVTIPANVAKNIVKGLTPQKHAALAAVQYVPLVAIGLQVKDFPGPEKISGVLFVKEDTAAYVNQTGVVAGYPKEGTIITICITNKKKVGLSDKETLAIVCHDLKIINPNFNPDKDILKYTIKQWPIGEVHMTPGFLSKYGKMLKEPAGHIYFGGEYASNFPTWGGGVWAGAKAAKDVLKAMGK